MSFHRPNSIEVRAIIREEIEQARVQEELNRTRDPDIIKTWDDLTMSTNWPFIRLRREDGLRMVEDVINTYWKVIEAGVNED